MTLTELLAEIMRALEAAEIPHMVAGSLASARHGEPRSTQDIDLVIDPSRSNLASSWKVSTGIASTSVTR